MKTRLIRIKEIAEISGLSITTIKNYINGGYYSARGFIHKDVGFPNRNRRLLRIKASKRIKIFAYRIAYLTRQQKTGTAVPVVASRSKNWSIVTS